MLRRDVLLILIWPVLALALSIFIWLYTEGEVREGRARAEAQIQETATDAAHAYAQQLGHMIEHIDQITLRLKSSWEEPGTTVNLERDRALGLFPDNRPLYASIFDRDGELVSSTVPSPLGRNISSLDLFSILRDRCCLGLTILPTSEGITLDRPVIRFARRLERSNGGFDGIALVSVEPRHLVIFQQNAVRGRHDFVSVRLLAGPLIATKAPGAGGDFNATFFRTHPNYAEDEGFRQEGADVFLDGLSRYVAWRRLEAYPLVALIGLSTGDALRSYQGQVTARRRTATFATLLVFALAAAASTITARGTRRRRQAEETQETYRLATDAANEGFCMLRPLLGKNGAVEDFRLEDCNNRAAALMGKTRQAMIGLRVSAIEPAWYAQDLVRLCRTAMQRGYLEEEVRVAPNTPIHARWIFRRLIRSPAGLALTVRDITEEKEQAQALAHLANNDALTKLPNRHWLNNFLPSEIKRVARQDRRLAILFIDLDNFKYVNDTLGHEAGDELLVQAAQRLSDTVRASDKVARLGGDEFVVILEYIDAVENVARVAGAIIASICRPFALSAGTGSDINASIGISLFPEHGRDAENLLKHADIAMYAAKAAGKGRFAFYHPHLSDTLILRLSKERALREAVEQEEFVVHYQPRVGLATGVLTSMEALVRWVRPGQDLVYPGAFIDVAEDMGLIVRLGELVIDKVGAQIAAWKAEGLPLVPISVNVSPQQLKSGTVSAYIERCLARHGIAPEWLEVELTESAVIDRSAVVNRELAALRTMGVKLMIDDFGTGYSSMAQLHRLDVDVLKVDKAFTTALSEGEEGRLLFTAIMSMASALNMCVVAEGVETGEQLGALRRLSCDEIQGHLVSEAVAPELVKPLLEKRVLLPRPSGPGRVVPA
jgi:diguanylate cyclase (GGDEF)-like protein